MARQLHYAIRIALANDFGLTMLSEPLPPFAAEWLAQRNIGHARLEELRIERLRQMTEAESARIFSMLDPPRPYTLRPSSGLVEQQRWFRLLRERQEEAKMENSA